MASTKQVNGKRIFILAALESLIVAYVTYFAALSLQWLDIIDSAMTLTTAVNVVLFVFFVIVSNLSLGLYELKLREPIRGILRRLFVSVIIGFFGVSMATGVLLPEYSHNALFSPIAIPYLLISLSIFRGVIHTTNAFMRAPNIVVLGAGIRASIIETRMRRTVDRANFNLMGFIPMAGDDRENGIKRERLIDYLEGDELFDFLVKNEIAEIIVACDQRRGILPVETLIEAKLRGIKVTDLLDFVEREIGQISVELLYPSWLLHTDGFDSQNYIRKALDSILNFTLSIVLLLLFWPFMLLTALAIIIEDGFSLKAPILYRQVRVGKHGKLFEIVKFRSMRPDAEKSGAKWASKNDNRVTAVGAFIRKYRLDELPQLFNILKGEMSFIGPRPERPEFVDQLKKEIPYFEQRHNVKPGLAGWAQLNYPYGASVKDSMEKLKFDLYYVKHQSLMLDLLILIRTIEVVLFGKGR